MEHESVPGLRECVSRWGLHIQHGLGAGRAAEDGHQHVTGSTVLACIDSSGREVVLKLARAHMRPDLEAAALAAWAGHGAPRLLDFAPEFGALLLERIRPGSPLPPHNDEEAIVAVVGALKALHAAAIAEPQHFPSHDQALEIWSGWARVNGEPDTIGLRLLDRALEVIRELAATASTSVLLHGDFIDKNLILGPDGYVAIDPLLPRMGDPCSDVGFYSAYHPPAGGIAQRARALARAAGYDPYRAARWGAAWAVGEATETWRQDSDELQAWVAGEEATALLKG